MKNNGEPAGKLGIKPDKIPLTNPKMNVYIVYIHYAHFMEAVG